MLYSRALSGNFNLLLHYEGREFGVSVGVILCSTWQYNSNFGKLNVGKPDLSLRSRRL